MLLDYLSSVAVCAETCMRAFVASLLCSTRAWTRARLARQGLCVGSELRAMMAPGRYGVTRRVRLVGQPRVG